MSEVTIALSKDRQAALDRIIASVKGIVSDPSHVSQEDFHATLQRAIDWITSVYHWDNVWIKPTALTEPAAVNWDSIHSIVFEWRNGKKSLEVFVDQLHVQYLIAWGPDINTEMKDGMFHSPGDFFPFYRWLMSDQQENKGE